MRHAIMTVLILLLFLTPIGAGAQSWTPVPWDASNFGVMSGGLVWTVEEADHATFKYVVTGNTMTIAVAVESTSMTGTANSIYLRIKIPGGYRSVGSGLTDWVFQSAYIRDAGTLTTGFVFTGGGSEYLYVSTPLSGYWQLNANNSAVYFTFTFEVQ